MFGEDVRDSFFQQVVEMAEKVEAVMVLTADHGAKALDEFRSSNPDRVINVGIAEQNMVSMAAGLASRGKLPIAYGINPFVSLRALEQITLDVAANNLPVTIASIGSGFAYSVDGASHHGLQDSNVMMGVPGLEVLNASDPASTRFFAQQIVQNPIPRYVRLEKGIFPNLPRRTRDWERLGVAEILPGDPRFVVLSTGSITHIVLEVLKEIGGSLEVVPRLVEVLRLNPLPLEQLESLFQGAVGVMVVEESYSALGLRVGALMAESACGAKLSLTSAPDRFFFKGSDRKEMRSMAGLSGEKLFGAVTRFVQESGLA